MVNTRKKSYSGEGEVEPNSSSVPAEPAEQAKVMEKKTRGKKRPVSENQQTVAEIVPNLQEVFVDLDVKVAGFRKVSPHGPPDALANYIIQHPQKFKKSRTKTKRAEGNVPQDTLETTLVTLLNNGEEEDIAERFRIPVKGNVLDAFLRDFHTFFTAQGHLLSAVSFDRELCSQLLHQHFPLCRSQLILHLVEEFLGRYSSAAAICFFVDCGYANLVQKYYSHLEAEVWDSMASLMPSARKKRKTWIEPPRGDPVTNSHRSWLTFLNRCQKDYPEIFDVANNRLVQNAAEIRREVEEFSCEVCLDQFPKPSAISCHFNDSKRASGDEEKEQCCSKSLDAPKAHYFCVECVRGQAHAATTEMPLAEGGIGLKCMNTESECRTIIPPAIRKVLNDRITAESVGMAQLPQLGECNFAIEVEVPKEEMKVFSCLRCKYEYCRMCGRDWDDYHFGKRCEEVEQDEEDHKEVDKGEQMSEAVMRKCDKCNVPFVKWDGCNKMVCRCGQTQCYLCRQTKINYEHFCQHFRQPSQKKCDKCNKKNAETENNQELQRIREEAARAGVEVPKLK